MAICGVEDQPNTEQAVLGPSLGLVIVGPTTPTDDTVYQDAIGPSSFGSGGLTDADSGSGAIVGLGAFKTAVAVPVGYVSGMPLGTSTDTWDNATFSSLGISPGIYVYTWGSGPTADSFTVDVVPEPSTWAMLLIGFASLAYVGYRKAKPVVGNA